MKGLAGIIYPNVFQISNLIIPMLDIMSHRGIKEKDSFSYKNIEVGVCGGVLGKDEKQEIIVGLDGSVYNKKELALDLRQHGLHVHYENIEEVLAAGYKFWGVNLFSKLQGDFSVFIFDRRKNKLFLCRDRIGKKPLYWYYDHNYFIFGSEIKSILSSGCVPQTTAPEAISMYFYFGYLPQDITPIKGISKLLPAYYLEIDLNKSMSINPYWSLSNLLTRPKESYKAPLTTLLDEKLNKSTYRRIQKSTNIGCSITGGLGSASIAYYLKKNHDPEHLQGYTVGFLGENDADVMAARDVASTLNIPLICKFITRESFLDRLVKIAWHLEEPIADPNSIAIWQLAETASKKTSSIFSGMGCHELLFGHSHYTLKEYKVPLFKRLMSLSKPLLRSVITPIIYSIHKPWAYDLLRYIRKNPWQYRYLSNSTLFDSDTLQEVTPKLVNLFDQEVFIQKFYKLDQIKSSQTSMVYIDIKTRLPDCYIMQYEKLTAAFSLNWCTPYLDEDVVDFLSTIPEQATLTEKETAHLLKSLMQPVFPPRFVNRPKRTKKQFLRSWIESPQSMGLLKLLLNGTLVDSGYINKHWLEKQLNDITVQDSAFQQIWAILMLEIWIKLYINNPISQDISNKSLQELLLEK